MDSTPLARILDPQVETRPDAPAVIARSGTLTYAELDAAADAQAAALRERGVRPGDVVAACLPNDLDIVVSFHATQRLGAVWAGIGVALTPAEQRAQCDLIRPALVLAGPDCPPWASTAEPNARWKLPPHAAAIALSSGTTGTPKTIVHPQEGLLLPARVLVETRGYGPDLVKGDSFAFTICNLQVLSTILVALAGGTAVVMDRRDPEGVAGWIGRHGVTLWNGAPAQVYDLAQRPGLDLSSLKEIWSGGGECPEYVRAAFERAHGIPVTPAYGLSEAPTVVSIDPVGGAHKDGAAGRVLPHLDVAAYDDRERRLPPGEQGELGLLPAAGGPWAGRWHGPLPTRAPASPPDGCAIDTAIGVRMAHPSAMTSDNSNKRVPLMTGDIGAVDAEGWLTMTDRKKLLIVRGGANVSPAEVERVLHEHPRVDRAVVFGVPDERLGERVAALLVTKGEVSAVTLREFCAERLARYKIPDAWGRVPALPVNAMNKVIRTDLPDLLRRAGPL